MIVVMFMLLGYWFSNMFLSTPVSMEPFDGYATIAGLIILIIIYMIEKTSKKRR